MPTPARVFVLLLKVPDSPKASERTVFWGVFSSFEKAQKNFEEQQDVIETKYGDGVEMLVTQETVDGMARYPLGVGSTGAPPRRSSGLRTKVQITGPGARSRER